MNSAINRHIAFFVYPGFVLLDLSAPLEASAAAFLIRPNQFNSSLTCASLSRDIRPIASITRDAPGRPLICANIGSVLRRPSLTSAVVESTTAAPPTIKFVARCSNR